jgi:hypothetical protein
MPPETDLIGERMCATHPDVVAILTCHRCGNYACSSCVSVSSPELCTACGSAMPPKTRHGCVTAYLGFAVVVNSIMSIVYLVSNDFILRALPRAEAWHMPVLAVGCLLNVAFAVALLRWKKWGFYGFVALAVVVFFFNLMIGVGGQSIGGLVGIVIMWVVLQVAHNGRKAWDLLE